MQLQKTLPTPHYSDDRVTLYHADIREIAGLLPEPALIITDPPYGISYCPKESYGASWAGAPIVGDESTDTQAPTAPPRIPEKPATTADD